MKVKDLRPRWLIVVAPTDSLEEAARHLAEDDIGALAVVSSHGPSGILSERDLVRAIADEVDLNETPVEDYMTAAPLGVDDASPIGEAIAKMNEYQVRHLIVLHDDDPVGMISMRDLVHLLGTDWPEL